MNAISGCRFIIRQEKRSRRAETGVLYASAIRRSPPGSEGMRQVPYLSAYELRGPPHAAPRSFGPGAWRFIALTSAAVIAVRLGAAALLDLGLTFEPAVLGR